MNLLAQNIRDTLAHSLGATEAEAKLIEANATGLPGQWYRARIRTPIFANLEAVARRDGSGAPIPGSVEWPISDLAIRDQPVVNPGTYVVPVRIGMASDKSLADHALRSARFWPVAAVDEDGEFVLGWINPMTLVRGEPPPTVEAYIAARRSEVGARPAVPNGLRLSPGAFQPRIPGSGIPGFTRPVIGPPPAPMTPPVQMELPMPAPEPGLSKTTKVVLVATGIAVALAAFSSRKENPRRKRRRRNRRRSR